MDRKLILAMLLASLPCRAQRGEQGILTGTFAAASCSATLVASGSNFNTSGGGTVAVTRNGGGNFCSSAGDLLVAVEIDHAGSTGPSVPTDGGDTFVNDKSITAGGIVTWFSFPNCSVARTTITCNPGAGEHSDCTVFEFSGAATSSPYDTAVTTSIGTSSADWNGYSLASTSNHCDIPIMAAHDAAAVAQYTAGTGWTIPAVCNTTPFCGNSNDGDGSLYAYALNVQGQMGAWGTRPTSSTINAVEAFYKAAVNGTVAGSYPTWFFNGTGGTNGGTPTVTTLNNSTFGGQFYYQGVAAWLLPISGNGTYDNTDEIPLNSAVTVQGSTTAAGTKGLNIEWNPSVLGVNDAYGYDFNALGNTASWCYDVWYDNTSNPTVSLTNITEIKGDNGGRATVLFGYNGGAGDIIQLETSSGTTSSGFNVVKNELYYQCIFYNGVAAGNSTVTTYDCGVISSSASCNPSTWSNLGTVTQAGQAGTTDHPVELVFGHVSGGSANINYRMANLQADWINATNPLGP